MRNRLDESGSTPTLVMYSGLTVVDLARLAELEGILDGALAAARGALRAAGTARLLVGGTCGLAPLTAPRALTSLDDAAGTTLDLEGHLEDLRCRVVAARAVYAEAENAATAVVARQASVVGRVGDLLLGTVLPASGAPRWATGLLGILFVGVNAAQDARRGVPGLVNVQEHLRAGARLLGPAVNPTGRVLLPRGWVPLAETTPVEFLSSSLLDLTGLDHFGGKVDVWVSEEGGVRHESSIRGGGVTAHVAVPIGAAVAIAPLRSVRDVLRRLRGTAAGADRSGVGRIELVAQRDAAGTTAWTVVLPGTREAFMAVNPQDHLSNIQLMGDERDDLLLAAKQALAMAPVSPGDPVVFVGHSQGGIAAAELAADPAVRARFGVAGVVSVGSPIGQVAIPETVPVISLENVDDVVPALDGLANPSAANRVTLQFDGGAHSAVLGPHDLWTYEAGYDRALAQDAVSLIEADSGLRAVANWSDPGATARVYTFEFARTDRVGSVLEAILHAGYGRR
ncbi:MAG: hypothetical protein ACQERF_06380 [Actinomycetota bacterium]